MILNFNTTNREDEISECSPDRYPDEVLDSGWIPELAQAPFADQAYECHLEGEKTADDY